jgi:hypothetical protein
MNRRDFLILGAGVALASCAPSPAAAKPSFYIVGDSIGEGLRWASGEPGDTKRGLPIRNGVPTIIHQIQGAPADATLIVSLGTNDAIAGTPVDMLAPYVTRILDERHGRRLVWVGPPEPHTSWVLRAKTVDAYLFGAVPAAGGIYVSLIGQAYKPPHAPDGVHYALAGYKALWRVVSAAAAKP